MKHGLRLSLCATLLASLGCRAEGRGSGPTAKLVEETSDASPDDLVPGIPITRRALENALNPKGYPRFRGGTGSIEGIVRMTGDPPPSIATKLPPDCTDAREVYGFLFREGSDRGVADALIAATDYVGYLPLREWTRKVTITHCAYEPRTIDVTYGQTVTIQNAHPSRSFLPMLEGVPSTAAMVALPRGEPVTLLPMKAGRFGLVDGMNNRWLDANIYVVQFPTHTVTGLGGHYRLDGLPPGKLKVSVLLPALDQSQTREVEIVEGKTLAVDFSLSFRAADYRPPPSSSGGDAGVVLR